MTKLQEIVKKYLRLLDKPIKSKRDHIKLSQLIKEMSKEQVRSLHDKKEYPLQD